MRYRSTSYIAEYYNILEFSEELEKLNSLYTEF